MQTPGPEHTHANAATRSWLEARVVPRNNLFIAFRFPGTKPTYPAILVHDAYYTEEQTDSINYSSFTTFGLLTFTP